MSKENWPEVIHSLRRIAAKKNINQVDLMFKTGLSQPTISRMFDLQFCPTLKTVEKVAEALNCELKIVERHDPQFFIDNEAAI